MSPLTVYRSDGTRRGYIASSPPLVTSLPSPAADGQEVYYRFTPNTTPASTIPLLWYLRYDAAISAWLPIGDQRPILAAYYPGSSTSMGVNAWGTYDANDPRLTIPLLGTYEVECGLSEVYGPTAANFAIGLAKNGVQWSEGGAAWSTANWAVAGQLRDINTFVVNDTLRMYYFLAAGAPMNIVMRGRYVTARPMRIG
jgi:hypothetical protein